MKFWKSPFPVDTSWLHLLLEQIWNKLKTHMWVPYITDLVTSCKSLSNHAMIFNTLPCVSVAIWMLQQNLPFLPSDMAYNISHNNLMNLSYIQERNFSNLMRSHINVSSNQVENILTKPINTPTYFTHIVMQIIK